jgi:hypothetical protein
MAEHHEQYNIRQYSRKPKSVGALAGQLRVLEEFANLRDENVKKFRSAHPDFFLAENLIEEGWVNGFLLRLGGAGASLIKAGAFHLAKQLSDELPDVALRMRGIVRLIWRGAPFANEYLKALLYGTRVEFDWKRGEIVYAPQNDFERALYALFRNSGLAKVCENPECPAPYFIAQRKSQCYCGEDCAVVYQREWKREWWKKKGSSRRRQQRAKKRKTKK